MGVNVAYPGRDGAHTAAACERLFPDGADLVALPSFSAVVEATAAGDVRFGVLPIESSLSGPVPETHDLLYDAPLSICGQAVLRIRHCLVGPADIPLDQIRVVRSHPAALDQCRRLLAVLPHATAIAAATTADAASQVAEHGDPAEVAIASERAAKLHGLTVIAGDVGDHPEAFTRFVSVAQYTRLDGDWDAWRTAFSFVTDHRPGALHRAIEPFGRHGIDLVQLVSRPIPQTPWRYRFDAVLDGHPLDPLIRETLAEVRGRTRQLRVFGSYPAETDRRAPGEIPAA
jgi:prephenate dehydratase